MARFLCQLCYTIVHYGEKHPCFVYGSDKDFHTILQLHESEETDIKHNAMIEENHTGNMNDSSATISSNILENNAEWASELNSRTAKHKNFFPTSKRKRKYPSSLADNTNNTHFESFRDGALRDSSDKIQVCEKNLRGYNAASGTIRDSQNAFESSTINSSHFEKTELSELENTKDLLDTRISTGAAPDSLSSKENAENHIKRLQELIKDVAAVAGPSGFSQCVSTLAEERKYACDLCPAQFEGRTDLVRHYRTHTGEKPFGCGICGKGFSRKGSLADHYRTHTGERPFECEICGQKFSLKSNLLVHYKLHTDNKPFECEICGEKFVRNDYLTNHYRRHTGEKPFACVICNKSFVTRGGLQQHAPVHTEERPFICGVCGMAFKRNADRNRHHTAMHPFN